MNQPLSQSIVRKSASNLALAFVLLPKEKRAGMTALYALCRAVDDVADEATAPLEERRAQLERWKADLRTACAGGSPGLPVVRELQPVIARCRLPLEHFEELLRGVEMDLDVARYPQWPDLEQYCYRVASVVGLLSIEVFGYRNPGCRAYAVALGKALQLTNILRDVRVDAQRGRIYLPQEELASHRVSEAEILRYEYSPRFLALATAVAGRARDLFRQARAALPPEDRRAMIAAELMGCVYWRLLEKLEARRFQVFDPRPTRLGRGHKCWLVLCAWARGWRRSGGSGYGGD